MAAYAVRLLSENPRADFHLMRIGRWLFPVTQYKMVHDGKPGVIWSPKLSEAEAAKRVYTTYGRKMLEGSHGGEPAREMWTPVETPAQGGWRFFKVGVEMR